MCLTAPARVLAVDEMGATVQMGGRQLRASTLVVPDAVAGDWVIVSAGTIVVRLSDTEAHELAAAVDRATKEET